MKPNLRKALIFISLVLFTGITFTALFVAIPHTERVFKNSRFDLNLKEDEYWKKSYIVELKIKQDDKASKQEKIDRTKNVIYKRLSNYGVEKIDIGDFKKKEEKKDGDYIYHYLRVTVETTKDQSSVEQLVTNRNYIRLMTQKEDIDFNSSENQYAYILPTSYDPTSFTRYYFRNVYVAKLKNNQGEDSYFAIFKTWPHKTKEFNKFLEKNKGKYVGIKTDTFVTPFSVPLTTSNSTVFAIPVANDEDSAEVVSLLFNSGVIPVEITKDSEVDHKPDIVKVDYNQVLLSSIAAALAVLVLMFIRKKESRNEVWEFAVAGVIVFAYSVAAIKIMNLPVDLFLITLEGFITLIMIKALTFNKNIRLIMTAGLLCVLITLNYLSAGYIREISRDLGLLLLLSNIAVLIAEVYINNMKKIILK